MDDDDVGLGDVLGLLTKENVGSLLLQNGNVFGSQVTAEPLKFVSIAHKSHEPLLAKGAEFGVLVQLGSLATDAFQALRTFCQRRPHVFHVQFSSSVVVVLGGVIVTNFDRHSCSARWSKKESSIIYVEFLEVSASVQYVIGLIVVVPDQRVVPSDTFQVGVVLCQPGYSQ